MSLDKFPVTLFFNRIIIQPDATEGVSKSGVIIPESSKGRANTGICIAIGPGIEEEPTVVKPGDKIIFRRVGSTIVINNKDYLLMTERDVLGIIDKKDG